MYLSYNCISYCCKIEKFTQGSQRQKQSKPVRIPILNASAVVKITEFFAFSSPCPTANPNYPLRFTFLVIFLVCFVFHFFSWFTFTVPFAYAGSMAAKIVSAKILKLKWPKFICSFRDASGDSRGLRRRRQINAFLYCR